MVPSLVPRNKQVNMMHLAEAPGHFIKCVESYINLRNKNFIQTHNIIGGLT